MKKRGIWLFNRLSILIITSLVLLLCLEALTRLILPKPRFDSPLPFYPYLKEEWHSINLRGVAPHNHYSTNQWGFRGEDPPDDWEGSYTIVTVGGSTTQCLYLDDKVQWAAVLQNQLRQTNPQVWVGNAGLNGHTTRGHLLVMEEIIPHVHPDVVVFLVGFNDLALSLNAEQRLKGSPFDKAERIESSLMTHSRLFQFASRLKNIYLDGATRITTQGTGTFIPKPLDPSLASPLPDDLTLILPQLPEYRQNLHQLIDLAEAQNIKVLFLTQPTLFENTPYWAGINSQPSFLPLTDLTLSAATWRRLLDIYNQTLLEICAERGVACYDLAQTLEPSETYYYDMIHFNDAGSIRVGELVAEALTTQLGNPAR